MVDVNDYWKIVFCPDEQTLLPSVFFSKEDINLFAPVGT